jgi:hypothetical protein
VSKHLPDVYTIRGLRAAQGYVFRDPLSAVRWLKDRGLTPTDHILILPAEVIYYGSNLTVDMRTTEQITLDKVL